jgi:Domain of unknown function (DUF4331)
MQDYIDTNRKHTVTKALLGSLCVSGLLMNTLPADASSHREAPFITSIPKVDGTDFYMFNSYEAGRENYVTLIANYAPLQDSYGGPNYFDLDKNAIYEIHIDQNGDAKEDLTFHFHIQNRFKDLKVNAGGKMQSVPLKNIGPIGPENDGIGAVTLSQTYSVELIKGDRKTGKSTRLTDPTGNYYFKKPIDNIGTKSIPDYENYARDHIYTLAIPQCGNAKVFVGQRKEGFVVNLGEVFDLVNFNPLGAKDSRSNTIADKNITTIALELPKRCLTTNNASIIGGWTTASLPKIRILNTTPQLFAQKGASLEVGEWVQVSRLGMPLVNEVVIGLKDKDRFNTSEPKNDAQFASYVTNPTLPELLEILFPGVAVAPNLFPRTDLVSIFLTGVPGLNQPAHIIPAEMLRLNTAIPAVSAVQQKELGVLAGDLAGFPNGRRPGDDVVDVALRAVMGALIPDATIAPNNQAPLTDGAAISALDFDEVFPYLKAPLPGANP